jgi:hypothetical protein
MESRELPEALGDLATKDKRKSIYAQPSQVADLSVGKGGRRKRSYLC